MTGPLWTAVDREDYAARNARRLGRALCILQNAFVVAVELRPSGFVRREWLTVVLEDGSRITGEVYRGKPIVRWIELPAEEGGRWRDGEEPVPGTPLGDWARSVVNEALRAHVGASRNSVCPPVAEAIVRANCAPRDSGRATA